MIKASDEKKLKSIEPKFYLDALNSKGFSVEDYGLDRRRLGRALGKILRKYGTWFNTADRYCFMIVNHMEESGLIKETADRFVVASDWREILQKMFPKENLEALEAKEQPKPEAPIEVAPEITQVTPDPSAQPEPTPQKIEVGSLKNNYEFYVVLLERMGGDFKTQDELRGLILGLYRENFGEEPESRQYFYNRMFFLQRNKILESIEDEGVTKHLRAENYRELLDAKKDFLEKHPYEFKTAVPAAPETQQTEQKEKPVETPRKKEEKSIPVSRQKEPTICVCINPADLIKLYETEVLFNDGHRCVVLLETIQANLDVLKNIEAEADPKSQSQLWEKLTDQREFYLAELAKIDKLCGKKA